MTIGYDTVNRCLAVKRTPENTSYEMMFKICINKLLDKKNITNEEIAKITGKSSSHVSNILRLLDLENEIQELEDKINIQTLKKKLLKTNIN